MSSEHCGVLGRIKPAFVCKVCTRSFSKIKLFKKHCKTCEEKLPDPLMRSGWIKCASSYYGLKGGGPVTTEKVKECEDLNLTVSDEVRDPYEFEEDDDPKILEYSSGRKRKREPTNLCQSLLFELCDKSVEIALNSEKLLKNVCASLLISDSKHNDSQGGDICQNDEEVLEDIFSKVLQRVDEEFSHEVLSKSVSDPEIKLFQCLNCNLSSSNADKLFNTLQHPCIGKYKLKCDGCDTRVKSGEDLKTHMRQGHSTEPILFLVVENVESGAWKTGHVLDNLCSKDCVRKQCFKVPAEEVEKQRSKLSEMKVSKLHKFLLGRLQTQKELGLQSECSLRLGSNDFCKAALSEVFGVSKYMVRSVFTEHLAGIKNYIHGNQGNIFNTRKKDSAISFILHFAKCHSENLPDKSCLRLPSYIDVKTIFEEYQDKTQKVNQVSQREFYLIFQKCFSDSHRLYDWLPRIVFLPSSSHPVCNECSLISDLRKLAKSEFEAHYAEGRKRTHMLYIRRKYLLYCYRRDLPIRYPQDYLHLSLDDMDQKKLHSPFTRVTTKDTSNMLRLSNHLTGCIVTNGGFETDSVQAVC